MTREKPELIFTCRHHFPFPVEDFNTRAYQTVIEGGNEFVVALCPECGEKCYKPERTEGGLVKSISRDPICVGLFFFILVLMLFVIFAK